MGKSCFVFVIGVLFIWIFTVSCSTATTYIVGDTAGWDISADLDTWPIDKNFTVGDSLMFQYSKMHSVAEVTKESYDGCNTTITLKTYTDGNTNVTLTKPGDMYFLCGNKLHCLGGMKLQIYVKEGQVAYAPAPAPAPSAGGFGLPNPSTKKNTPAERINNPSSSADQLHLLGGLMLGNVVSSFFLPAIMVVVLLLS